MTLAITRLKKIMQDAVNASVKHVNAGGLPFVGIVVDSSGSILGCGVNRVEETGDLCAHAEIVAMREVIAMRKSITLHGLDAPESDVLDENAIEGTGVDKKVAHGTVPHANMPDTTMPDATELDVNVLAVNVLNRNTTNDKSLLRIPKATSVLTGCILFATGEPCGLCYRFAITHGITQIYVAVDRDEVAKLGFDYLSSYRALGISDERRASLLHLLPVKQRMEPFTRYLHSHKLQRHAPNRLDNTAP